MVHQLSKHTTQNPFRKNRGRVVRVLFHPFKPFLFVATQNHVRVYNLAQQALAKKLIGGSGSITSMAIHPGGDHVIVGSEVNLQSVCVDVLLFQALPCLGNASRVQGLQPTMWSTSTLYCLDMQSHVKRAWCVQCCMHTVSF